MSIIPDQGGRGLRILLQSWDRWLLSRLAPKCAMVLHDQQWGLRWGLALGVNTTYSPKDGIWTIDFTND